MQRVAARVRRAETTVVPPGWQVHGLRPASKPPLTTDPPPPPPEPLTVRVYVALWLAEAAGAGDGDRVGARRHRLPTLAVSQLAEPPAVTDAGLSVTLTPEGAPVALRPTDCADPRSPPS